MGQIKNQPCTKVLILNKIITKKNEIFHRHNLLEHPLDL